MIRHTPGVTSCCSSLLLLLLLLQESTERVDLSVCDLSPRRCRILFRTWVFPSLSDNDHKAHLTSISNCSRNRRCSNNITTSITITTTTIITSSLNSSRSSNSNRRKIMSSRCRTSTGECLESPLRRRLAGFLLRMQQATTTSTRCTEILLRRRRGSSTV